MSEKELNKLGICLLFNFKIVIVYLSNRSIAIGSGSSLSKSIEIEIVLYFESEGV